MCIRDRFPGEEKFIHRDIKPQNILIAAPGVAKVSDFGLAKDFQKAGLSGMSVTGSFAGTVDYMPREQITNFKYVKPPTDVWSMGATIYNMLTGATPRDLPIGEDPMQVVLRGPIVPIQDRGVAIPPRIAAVIDHAWSTTKRQRSLWDASIDT